MTKITDLFRADNEISQLIRFLARNYAIEREACSALTTNAQFLGGKAYKEQAKNNLER